MIRSCLPLFVVLCLGCKTAETPKPAAPVEVKAEPVKPAEPPPPPPEPKVELPPAPPLPHKPLGLPEIPSPEENQTTPEKAELGFKLFFDKRLSKDGSMACGQCHEAHRSWTTENVVDTKVGGGANKRNTPSVVNLGLRSSYYWDGRMTSLEAVAGAAWKGQLGADPATIAAALNEVPVYKAMFQRAFQEPATALNVPKALAAFFRTLNTGNSAWDRAQAGDASALTAEQKEGFKVFTSKGCVTCHVPPLFTHDDFENIGLGDDPGRKDATKADADLGKFRVPSLRNVALTAPYFHDGSAKTLEEAIAFMAKGGNKNPNLSAKLKPQKLSAKEAKALKAFLESLTGDVTWSVETPAP